MLKIFAIIIVVGGMFVTMQPTVVNASIAEEQKTLVNQKTLLEHEEQYKQCRDAIFKALETNKSLFQKIAEISDTVTFLKSEAFSLSVAILIVVSLAYIVSFGIDIIIVFVALLIIGFVGLLLKLDVEKSTHFFSILVFVVILGLSPIIFFIVVHLINPVFLHKPFMYCVRLFENRPKECRQALNSLKLQIKAGTLIVPEAVKMILNQLPRKMAKKQQQEAIEMLLDLCNVHISSDNIIQKKDIA